MKIRSGAVLLGCAVFAIAQQKPTFTARELFYSAPQATATPAKPVAPGPAKPAAQTAARTPKRTPTESASSKQPVKPDTSALSKESDLQPQSSDSLSRESKPVAIAATNVSMAPAPANGTPLGLRYTILKRNGGEMTEVAPGTVFHTGDAIQFSVQSNGPGYLYIIAQGSSGTWKPLFPSPDVADGNNFVDGWRPYSMPPSSRVVFDEVKGTEKVFIVLSREPEVDLEKTIYMLQNGARPSATQQSKQMVAMNQVNIDDKTVGNLRNVYSRDLVIEKVTPGTPGERKETAVYVVNPTGSSASRVVADIQLVHQ